MRVHRVDLTREPRPDHVVGGAVENRRDESFEFLGRVLAVGITERDGNRLVLQRGRKARPHRGTEAARRLAHDDCACSARGRGAVVGGTVVDDDHDNRVPAHFARRPPDDRADGCFFVASREKQDDRPMHQANLTSVRLP